MLGSLSIIVAHHMYSMPPYAYLATDYATQLSLFTHHVWIGVCIAKFYFLNISIFKVLRYL